MGTLAVCLLIYFVFKQWLEHKEKMSGYEEWIKQQKNRQRLNEEPEKSSIMIASVINRSEILK